jgi:hypothetical protein
MSKLLIKMLRRWFLVSKTFLTTWLLTVDRRADTRKLVNPQTGKRKRRVARVFKNGRLIVRAGYMVHPVKFDCRLSSGIEFCLQSNSGVKL